jgi:hypothetical protein
MIVEENPQELPLEGEGQVFEPLSECPNHGPSTFHWGKPQTFHFPFYLCFKLHLSNVKL